MSNITLNVPDEELGFFLLMVQKLNYTVSELDFYLSEEHIRLLDHSSQTPNHECISLEDFNQKMKAKYGF